MKSKHILIVGILFMLFSACSPKVIQLTNDAKEQEISTTKLIQQLDSLNNTMPTTFYGRASTNYHDSQKNNYSFKTSLRIQSDSAATALITFSGIPIISAIVTQDSVKFQNKRNKCYTENSIDYFNDFLGYPFEYNNIIQILLGLPVAFERTDNFYQLPDKVYHILMTKKVLETEENNQLNKKEILLRYYLVKDGNVLEKVEIESPKDAIKVVVSYGKRAIDETSGLIFPNHIYTQIESKKNKIDISFEFDRTEINQAQEINYSVPVNYEVCH